MSVNSTSHDPLHDQCSPVSIYIVAAFSTVRAILLVPFCTLVLYLGVQRWRQHSSKPASHFDVFTYHLAVMELIYIIGIALYFWGTFTSHLPITQVGTYVAVMVFYGEMFFHLLTCVERYLAVVHPVTYLGLRNARGARIRNISVGCVWLLCLGLIAPMPLAIPHYSISLLFSLLITAIVVISFCSISVVCVLIRSGPGREGGEKQRVDQSKQRAFHTIAVISGGLWLWFVGVLVSFALGESSLVSHSVLCVLSVSVHWFNLPNSLVSPLLYLHRAGKLPRCCHNNE